MTQRRKTPAKNDPRQIDTMKRGVWAETAEAALLPVALAEAALPVAVEDPEEAPEPVVAAAEPPELVAEALDPEPVDDAAVEPDFELEEVEEGIEIVTPFALQVSA